MLVCACTHEVHGADHVDCVGVLNRVCERGQSAEMILPTREDAAH